MDDLNPIDEVATEPGTSPEETARRRRRSLALRTGATAVVACGLAAGSYGIAAASSSSGTPRAASALTATSSKPSSTKPTAPSSRAPRLGGPWGFGRFGEGPGALGSDGFGRGGTVKSITATTITVVTALRGTVTVTTNSSTTYREGGKTVTRSALAAGDEVVFLSAARPSSSSTSSSTLVGAVEIVLPHVSGKVVSINGSQVVVAQADGLYVTVNVSPSTSYDEAGQTATSSAVVAGAEVSVTGTLSSDHFQIDATTIEVLLPSVSGQVTAVSGTTITIKSFDGTTETVTTGPSTLFRNRSSKTTIASVAKGDLVEAFGTPGSGNAFSAVTVDVGPSTSAGPAVPGGPGHFGRGRFGGPRGDNRPMGGFGGAAGWGTQGSGATSGAGASGVATSTL